MNERDRARWLWLVAGLVLAAGVVWLPAARGGEGARLAAEDEGDPAEDEAKQEDEDGGPHGGGEEHVVVHSNRHPFEEWRLPDNWRRADGAIDQEVLVAHQKKRIEVINKRFGAHFELAETEHYLIFSDAEARLNRLFATWAEALYSNLGRQFRIRPTERVWDGKCILLFFRRRSAFVAHGRVFDMFDPSHWGAYFVHEVAPPDHPQLVHICIPIAKRDPKRIQELLAHEGTHAFFQLYKRPVDLPLWLHEGLAEFMTVVNDRSLRRKKQRYAIMHARRGTGLQGLFERPSTAGLSYPEYNISYTLVDFLLAAGRPKFKRFVDGLKEGEDQETALQQAYGWSLWELEQRWRVYVDKVLAAGR